MSTGLKLCVGEILEVAEADYMYGEGPLAIRLTEVSVDPGKFPAMEWVEVRGVVLYPQAEAEQPRYATIRVSAIKRALRPPGWRPPDYPPRQSVVRRTTGRQHSPEAK